MRTVFMALAVLAAAVFGQTDDGLIVPGERVGPVTRTSTEESLIRAFGKKVRKENIYLGEGFSEPGLVFYSDDPSRRLEILWTKDQPRRPSFVKIMCKIGSSCHWHTATGVGRGTRLKDLEHRNGKPFTMFGWAFDGSGRVFSYEGGNLEREFAGRSLSLRVEPCTEADLRVKKSLSWEAK
jgi:hypothetical protein